MEHGEELDTCDVACFFSICRNAFANNIWHVKWFLFMFCSGHLLIKASHPNWMDRQNETDNFSLKKWTKSLVIKKQLPPDGVVKRERRTDKKVAELMPKITANEFEMRAKRITYAQKTAFGARMRGAFPSFFSLSLKCLLHSKLKISKHNSLGYASFLPDTVNVSVGVSNGAFSANPRLITFHERESFQAIKCASHV